MNIRRISIIAALAIIVVILGGFGFWYLYIQHQQQTLDTTNAGRGLGETLNSAFPVGSTYSNIVNTIGGIIGNNASSTNVGSTPRLWQASAAPVAGIAWATPSSTPLLRFIDTASGNVFDANPVTDTSVRMSNTLKPQVYQATVFGTNGAILQSMGDLGIETFSGTLIPATTTAPGITSSGPGSLIGTMLPRGIIAVAARSGSDNIFYIAPYQTGVAGYLIDHVGSSPKRIWTSSLSEWRAAWAGNSIILSTPASGGVSGFVYKLTTNGDVTSVLGNIPGLTALANESGDILYSSSDSLGTPKLFLQKASGSAIAVPLTTFAEKCVWANTTTIYCAVPHAFTGTLTLPDAWYRGEVHFSDSLWKFNTNSGTASLLFDPSSDNKNLDILNLTVSSDGAYLGFIDVNTGSGWTLHIQQ